MTSLENYQTAPPTKRMLRKKMLRTVDFRLLLRRIHESAAHIHLDQFNSADNFQQEQTMTATLLYRIATVLLGLFTVGHTVGFLTFKPLNQEGVAVRDAMDTVPLQGVGSGKLTYGGFYRGFGLFCTVYLAFTAYLAWHLGSMAQNAPQSIENLGWAFFAVQLASIALSWIYFLPPPIILSTLAAICT